MTAALDIEGLVSQIDIDELGLDEASLYFDESDTGGYPADLYTKPADRISRLQESAEKHSRRNGHGALNEFGFFMNEEAA